MMTALVAHETGQDRSSKYHGKLPGYLYAQVFDDKDFWLGQNNQRWFLFQGQLMQGTEVNYYFQGMIAKYCYVPAPVMLNFIIPLWKQLQHGTNPTPNVLWAANLGYQDEPADYALWAAQHSTSTK
jgi:hypothetical protein